MEMNDLTIYPIKFNVSAAVGDIIDAIDVCLDELSVEFQEIIKDEIWVNGNGSNIMKEEAKRHVKEISRKNDGHTIELEVGVDESEFGSEQAKIRTIVVLHGNLANGALFTKPGQATWTKHVGGKHMSNAIHEYRLADFEQTDVTGNLMKNSMKQIQKYVMDFLRAIDQTLDTIDFSDYLTVG